MAWLLKIFKSFFFSLDNTLFNFISTLYDLLMDISRTTILTQGDIADLVGRIQLLLGIFMLFKLSFSFITYIVNPDDFSDKSKGFGKLMQNAVISLIMLVLVPYVFQMAYNLQTKILEENVLAELILGTEDEGSDYLASAGNKMAFYVMLPFFKPNYSISGLEDCLNLYDEDGFNDKCRTSLDNLVSSSNLTAQDVTNYKYGVENQSLGLTFRMAPAIALTDDDDFVFDYKWPISTVVAVVVCLLLVTFCIDVGVRSIKLAFLQLIYPIPVIAYMDPKAGKDGIFKKWYQMCISTFLSLFIRLLALYFGVYIIAKVGDLGLYDVVTGSQITNGWVFIFIIIGVLMFVKQFPKILESLGIKLDGDGKFTLNPLKKFTEGTVGGKQILGAGAAGLAGAAAVGTNLLLNNRTKNPFKRLGSAIAGGISATSRGMFGAAKGEKFGKNFSNSYGGAMNAKTRRRERKDDDVEFYEPWIQTAQDKMGLENQAKINEGIVKKYQSVQKNAEKIKNAKSTLTSLVEKNPDMDEVRNQKNIWDNTSAESFMKNYNSTHPSATIDFDTAVKELAKRQKKADDDYKTQLKAVLGANINNADVQNAIKDINTAIGAMDSSKYSKLNSSDINTLWDQIGFASPNSEQAREDYSNATTKISEASTGKEASHISDVAKYTKKSK